ncbi:hypothetical protein HPP92_003175 [Vanilla planifolia]|uniref:BZIP domain-containing protein n=1 Tax=Vanilla planifolia TaxID=51239 RepID=A0A835VHB9_VANPL|nr:hypothetical protein HPP92_003568 [Vanilla planifolia]KAG0503103.1 hypothetical protein HPP92_003175 [Vanilla planifolia]
MSAKPARQSSSSEVDLLPAIDERKRKRMQSNKESARRSRMRKQQRLEDLINEVVRLKEQNSQMEMRINDHLQHYQKMESENTVIRTQVMELSDRLESLNSLIRFVEDFNGIAMDVPESADPFVKPWEIPFPLLPISASANMFQC